MSHETLGGFFLAGAARHPGRALVKQPDQVRSYAEVAVSVASTVAYLREAGIRRGDYVACFLEDQIPNLYFELACALSGVVAVPLSPLFSVDYFVEGIVRRVGAKAVLTTPAGAAALGGRGLRLLAYPDGTAAAPVEGLQLLDDLSMDWEQAVEALHASAAGIAGSDVFVVQPTSGSTGQPKLVLRRHAAFTRYAHFVGDQLTLADAEQPMGFLAAATLTHAFGLHMLATALRKGGTLCVPGALDTAASLDEVRAMDPVVLPILPRMQRALMRQYERDHASSERIFGPAARYVCSAGGVADPDLLEKIRRTGIDIIEFYGSSEASVVAVTQRGKWRPGWSGQLAPDAEVKVTADGELAVRSPGVMPGYFGEPEANAAAFDDEGYYLTGDLGEITADRQLRILGRKRDIFNTPEGSNIYPARIEQQLESLPGIEAAVLIGDQRPYLAALLVVHPMPHGHGGPRFLDPDRYADFYDEIGMAIEAINASLERVEKVIRFAVLGNAFSTDAYRVVGPGKIRRDRKAVGALYEDVIGYLYTRTQLPDPSFVPGTDRRLRPQQRLAVPDMPIPLPAAAMASEHAYR